MKAVKSIPDPAPRESARDPWFNKVLDGTLWILEPADWSARYATARSAQSAIRQAAQARKLGIVIAQRGDDLYVQATDVPEKPKATKAAPRKAAAKPVPNGTTKKATARKAPAKKAPTTPPGVNA